MHRHLSADTHPRNIGCDLAGVGYDLAGLEEKCGVVERSPAEISAVGFLGLEGSCGSNLNCRWCDIWVGRQNIDYEVFSCMTGVIGRILQLPLAIFIRPMRGFGFQCILVSAEANDGRATPYKA